ncbi:hypothetical protein K523DRAFT_358923 [Schizophyllum commune Tattone D]|nr:hypothetical protein K523DRAFT_358923 [Schizophyllum commune Tattone D]
MTELAAAFPKSYPMCSKAARLSGALKSEGSAEKMRWQDNRTAERPAKALVVGRCP